MNQASKSKCPICNSEEFIINPPNRYDYLNFTNGHFQVYKSEFTNGEEKIFCRECGAEIDEKKSMQSNKVVLKNTN
ncbi:MAG: hypothetical protein U9P79_08215 [Candidatus Cloacimonadota bacterium]|nr:hypothetical protein [Candidatus Cloacimonadota bacterium]